MSHARPTADPYLPGHGDAGYGVESLRPRARLPRRRATGSSGRATIAACAAQDAGPAQLSTSPGCASAKVTVDGRRPASASRTARGKLDITLAAPARRRRVHRRRHVRRAPAPVRRPVGRGRLGGAHRRASSSPASRTARHLVPVQRPARDKARYRISITTDSPYHGRRERRARVERASRRAARRGCSSRPSRWRPTSRPSRSAATTTVDLAHVTGADRRRAAGAAAPRVPVRLRPAAGDDDAVRPAVRAVPVRRRTRSWSPTTTSRSRSRRRASRSSAPTMSTGGAARAAGRPRAGAPVVRQQPDARRAGSDIWLHEGFACYAEWLWSEESGGRQRRRAGRDGTGRTAAPACRRTWCSATPGRTLMFDDRVYKRGALTLHALRSTSATTRSSTSCAPGPRRTGTARSPPPSSLPWRPPSARTKKHSGTCSPPGSTPTSYHPCPGGDNRCGSGSSSSAGWRRSS